MSDVLFAPADLTSMRAFNEANLPDTCVVMMPTLVDIPGGQSTTYTASRTISCRVSHPTRADLERFAAAQTSVKPTCIVVVAAGESIDTKARLVLSGVTLTTSGSVGWSRTVELIGDAGPLTVTMMRKYPCVDV